MRRPEICVEVGWRSEAGLGLPVDCQSPALQILGIAGPFARDVCLEERHATNDCRRGSLQKEKSAWFWQYHLLGTDADRGRHDWHPGLQNLKAPVVVSGGDLTAGKKKVCALVCKAAGRDRRTAHRAHSGHRATTKVTAATHPEGDSDRWMLLDLSLSRCEGSLSDLSERG